MRCLEDIRFISLLVRGEEAGAKGLQFLEGEDGSIDIGRVVGGGGLWFVVAEVDGGDCAVDQFGEGSEDVRQAIGLVERAKPFNFFSLDFLIEGRGFVMIAVLVMISSHTKFN